MYLLTSFSKHHTWPRLLIISAAPLPTQTPSQRHSGLFCSKMGDGIQTVWLEFMLLIIKVYYSLILIFSFSLFQSKETFPVQM